MNRTDPPPVDREVIVADQHLLSVHDAARRAGVSQQTIYDWVRRGHLVAIATDTGQTRVRYAEVMRLREVRRFAAGGNKRITTVLQWLDTPETQGYDGQY